MKLTIILQSNINGWTKLGLKLNQNGPQILEFGLVLSPKQSLKTVKQHIASLLVIIQCIPLVIMVPNRIYWTI